MIYEVLQSRSNSDNLHRCFVNCDGQLRTIKIMFWAHILKVHTSKVHIPLQALSSSNDTSGECGISKQAADVN